MNPWDAEVDVTVDLVTRLVRSQFPELTGEVAHLGTGWDNDVFTVGPDLVFRLPRRAAALPLMERELAVLPLLPALLPGLGLPVPRPRYRGVPGLGYPWPFWGGPLVPGVELCRAPGAPRAALGAAVGGFLRRLHALRVDVDLPHDPMGRGDAARRAAMARDPLAALGDLGLVDPSAYRLLDDPHLPGPSSRRVLVHGDLHVRHALVLPDGSPGGVIDFGDSCWADPSVDVSFAFSALEGEDRAAFFAAYGSVDAACEVRARVLAVNLCAALAASAHDTGDEELLAESLAGLRRALD